MTEKIWIYALAVLSLAAVIICIAVLSRIGQLGKELTELKNNSQNSAWELSEMRKGNQEMVQMTQLSIQTFGELISHNQKDSADNMDKRLAELSQRFSHMAQENEQKLEQIRTAMEKKIGDLTSENSKQLEEMRRTVDEKLQKTLDDRITQSFKLVNDRLEQVYKGLGEMQNLAVGVGDLKKVLSNVKTRGILGEVQLGAILEQILSPEQYEENVITRSMGSERVESLR